MTTGSDRPTAVPLWDGVAPGSESWTHGEQPARFSWWEGREGLVRNVAVPTVTTHLPDEPTGEAVVVCPGGGMIFLSMDDEGIAVADFLTARGITAYVVAYRLIPTPEDDAGAEQAMMDVFRNGLEPAVAPVVPLACADVERALAIARGAGHHHVSLLGFSAGARVSFEVVRHGVELPDTVALVYLPTAPAFTPTESTPPAFIAAAVDDGLGIAGSLDLHAAWRAAGRPAELHLFDQGDHGFGLGVDGLSCAAWPEMYVTWFRSHTSA